MVRVYLSIAATTQDPAGQDPHQHKQFLSHLTKISLVYKRAGKQNLSLHEQVPALQE